MLLSQAAIVKVPFPIIIIRSITGPAQQVIRKAHHMVDRAKFLVFISQSPRKLSRRYPELPIILPARTKIPPVGDRAAPVSLYNLPPSIFSGHFPGPRCPMNLRDGCV